MIWFVLPDLSAGGAERVTITFARILKQKGFPVEFIILGKPEGEMASWICPDFKMTCFYKKRSILAFFDLCNHIKHHPKDLFFSSREHVNLITLLASRLENISKRVIVRVPNMPNNKLSFGIAGTKMGIIKILNRALFPSARWVIAQNEEMRRQLIDSFSLNKNCVVTINNPVDKERVLSQATMASNPYNEGEYVFLNVCNIAYSKGIDTLLEAWPEVKREIPTAHMYLVGRDTSDYAQQIKKQAMSLRDFTFIGFCDNPYPYFKYCDVFVLPSRMEGFPNVVLEALCFNKPIASTLCVDVLRDIIKDGYNGYLCEPNCPSALSEAMVKASKLRAISNEYDLFDENQLVQLFHD